ncbi:hypothetical protein Ahy_B03g067885 [Arachis hypogaea]|uniref:Uncharacterized protein n=1 Tax=Arachis hypogaea TaxID=3818 RepID=A0A445A7Z5_ARAHY|nr:hypothetical protein Ahy_B03g067885 [Arachis hypogaea]
MLKRKNFNMLKALVEEIGMEHIDRKFLRDNALRMQLVQFQTHPLIEANILEEIRANFIHKLVTCMELCVKH